MHLLPTTLNTSNSVRFNHLSVRKLSHTPQILAKKTFIDRPVTNNPDRNPITQICSTTSALLKGLGQRTVVSLAIFDESAVHIRGVASEGFLAARDYDTSERFRLNAQHAGPGNRYSQRPTQPSRTSTTVDGDAL